MSFTNFNIAHVVCTYPPYRGGMGNVAFAYVSRLRARGWNTHVFTSREREQKNEDESFVHRVPSVLTFGNASVLPSLFYRLKGFDLIHLHYPFFGGAEPVIVRKAIRDNQGLVLTYHMDATASGFKGMLFEAHKKMLLPWILERADRILVSSQSYADHSSLAQYPSVRDRIEIHPFGVDTHFFSPGDEHAFAQEKKIDVSIPTLLFVGGLDRAHAFKGIEVLFNALSLLSDLSFQLLIVGDGELRLFYEQEAQRDHIHDRVRFVGAVSREDLPRYYRLSHLHVFPSTSRAEAFGLVALEAGASGIPTIASDLPGVSSVVVDGVNGLVVPPQNAQALAQAIRLLLQEPRVRAQLGESARVRAQEQYDWDQCLTRLEETYRSVLSRTHKEVYH